MVDIKSEGTYLAAKIKEGAGGIYDKASGVLADVKDIQPIDAIRLGMKVPGARIDRTAFLNNELMKHFPEEKVKCAIDHNPAYAGISKTEINIIANGIIADETKKVSGVSFVAGMPGGLAMIGTIPADLVQYIGFMLRAMQKLAYLYGFKEFEFDEKQISDNTMNEMLIFMGVMFGVEAANGGLIRIAELSSEKISKSLAQKAFTKGTVPSIVKTVLESLGIKITKEAFAKGVSKAVPVVGGVVSGGLSYASFRACCNRLKKNLMNQDLCNPSFYKKGLLCPVDYYKKL